MSGPVAASSYLALTVSTISSCAISWPAAGCRVSNNWRSPAASRRSRLPRHRRAPSPGQPSSPALTPGSTASSTSFTAIPRPCSRFSRPPAHRLVVGRSSSGRWQFPLARDRVESLRRGEAFWDVLERHGIETTIIRMPANFPPSRTATRELSGMGTPDLLGTYGTFSLFTSRPPPPDGTTVSGGIMVPVDVVDGVVGAGIEGPENPYLVEPHKTRVDFTAYIDSASRYVKLVVGNEQRLLRVGEWSDWVPVELPLLPLVKLAGESRFYLKQINPHFEMYVEPDQPRPVQAGAADLHAPRLRVRARPCHRPLLHAGDARGDERPEGRRADNPASSWSRRALPPKKTSASTVTCSIGSTMDSSFTTSATSIRCRT